MKKIEVPIIETNEEDEKMVDELVNKKTNNKKKSLTIGLKLELHAVDDWEVLYVNGQLVNRGDHREVFLNWMKRDAEYPLTISSFDTFYHEGDVIDKFVKVYAYFPTTLEDLYKISEEVGKEYEELERKGLI